MTTVDAAGRPAAALSRKRWTGRTRGGVLGNWIFLVLLKTCGLRAAYALLVPVTFYYLFTAAKALRASREYLARRLSPANPATTFIRVWKHFFRFGQILIDRAAIIAGLARFEFEFDGEEHLEAALAKGRGLLLVTAHVGNWEAAGHMLSRLGVPVNVVAYEGELARVKRLFDRAMSGRKLRVIEAGDSLETGLKIISALGRGEIVAMHADRALDAKLVAIDFLGAEAGFPSGPYLVAATTGVPLITAFVARKATGKYLFKAWPAENLKSDSRDERDHLVRETMARFAGRLEDFLKENPYQWLNFYDFWGDAALEK